MTSQITWNKLFVQCWGELKSLRGQSVGEVRLVMRAIFRICGDESQPRLGCLKLG